MRDEKCKIPGYLQTYLLRWQGQCSLSKEITFWNVTFVKRNYRLISPEICKFSPGLSWSSFMKAWTLISFVGNCSICLEQSQHPQSWKLELKKMCKLVIISSYWNYIWLQSDDHNHCALCVPYCLLYWSNKTIGRQRRRNKEDTHNLRLNHHHHHHHLLHLTIIITTTMATILLVLILLIINMAIRLVYRLLPSSSS